jgi:hypothetical protein
MVTLFAATKIVPVTSRPSMTVPGVLTVNVPLGRSVVPARTPVLAAVGFTPLSDGIEPHSGVRAAAVGEEGPAAELLELVVLVVLLVLVVLFVLVGLVGLLCVAETVSASV